MVRFSRKKGIALAVRRGEHESSSHASTVATRQSAPSGPRSAAVAPFAPQSPQFRG